MTIPSGPLRENLETLKNYNHVFINGNLNNLENLKIQILKINTKINIHVGKYIPLNLNEFNLKNDYLAFSGIGNHQTFISMIRNNGMKIIKDIEFPDHFQFSEKDINEILRISKELNCKIITTEKDFLRISSKKTDQIKFIKSDLHILDEEKFINAIIN